MKVRKIKINIFLTCANHLVVVVVVTRTKFQQCRWHLSLSFDFLSPFLFCALPYRKQEVVTSVLWTTTDLIFYRVDGDCKTSSSSAILTEPQSKRQQQFTTKHI